jgi:predicted Zn-dependent protease
MLEASQAGRAMVGQAFAAGMPWGDPSLGEYVNRLGQELARRSGSQQAFAFYVLYDPRVNAQAFPGGHIVINSGAVSLAENEAELASVLSHEIAHENACDWRATPSKGNLGVLIAMVPAVMLGGPAGIALVSATGVTSKLGRAKSQRIAEKRADRLAAEYLVRAGYDPRAQERFLERLEVEGCDGAPSGLLATHPHTADRRKALEQISAALPPPALAPHDDKEFLRMRKAVRDFDDSYSRIVGVRIPCQPPPTPELSRRPAGR